jgi:hypothetical protein
MARNRGLHTILLFIAFVLAILYVWHAWSQQKEGMSLQEQAQEIITKWKADAADMKKTTIPPYGSAPINPPRPYVAPKPPSPPYISRRCKTWHQLDNTAMLTPMCPAGSSNQVGPGRCHSRDINIAKKLCDNDQRCQGIVKDPYGYEPRRNTSKTIPFRKVTTWLCVPDKYEGKKPFRCPGRNPSCKC